MSRPKYLLDTHAFLWVAIEEERLSGKARRAIAAVQRDQLAISDITLQEIGLLLHAGKISFSGSPSATLGRWLEFVVILPITLDIAIAAPALAVPHGDQFDRIIAATARIHGLTLITKDANITDAGVVPVLW